MALIECPECGKDISDRAIACPNCGNPMGQPISEQKIKVKGQREGCFLQTLNVGCMIFFVILLIFFLIAVFG